MFLELYEHIFDQTRRKLTQIAELSLLNLQRSMGENRPYKIIKIIFKQALNFINFITIATPNRAYFASHIFLKIIFPCVDFLLPCGHTTNS